MPHLSDMLIASLMARLGLTEDNLEEWAREWTGGGAKAETAALILTVRHWQNEYLRAAGCDVPQSVRNPRVS